MQNDLRRVADSTVDGIVRENAMDQRDLIWLKESMVLQSKTWNSVWLFGYAIDHVTKRHENRLEDARLEMSTYPR